MYSAYDVLNLTPNATVQEIDARYAELKQRYQNDRYLVGLAGEEAAEKLQKLEVAYQDIMSERNANDTTAQDLCGDSLDKIREAIKNNDLNSAQKMLDDSSTRNAEWHYLQSVVFYKNNWFLESKKQLEFCIAMEPNNTRYRQSLEKLDKIIASNTISAEQLRTTTTSTAGGGIPHANNGTCTGNACCDCMLCNMCYNCMCNMCIGGC